VVLAYDGTPDLAEARELPEDIGAEHDDERTAQSLIDAIRACGHEASGLLLDERFPSRVRQCKPDLVFNIAEGVRGPTRESIVPAWLDHLGIPYTGSDGLALALSLDKALAKTMAAAQGVRTPAFRRVSSLSELEGISLEFPLFVKPNGEGSSMGVRPGSMVQTPEQLRRQVSWVLSSYRQDCLVEEFAPGREFCVGLLGNEEPQLLPVVEVRSSRPFYSYEDKHAHNKELTCPADLPEGTAGEMGSMALTVFRALGCRDLARVDFKLDASGAATFLEMNPLPGLSPDHSIFPVQARAAGIAYEELVGRIVELAVARRGSKP